MNQILSDKFKFLPDVLIQQIINYTNVVVYRNGRYINRLKINDKNYSNINKIPRPIRYGNKITIKLMNYLFENPYGYYIEYIFDNCKKVNIKFIVRETDGYDKYYVIKSNATYIYDVNSKLSKLIQYSM
jgi:hypothetical protein